MIIIEEKTFSFILERKPVFNSQLDKALVNLDPKTPEEELLSLLYYWCKFQQKGEYSEADLAYLVKSFVEVNYRKGYPKPKHQQKYDGETY